MQAEKYAATDFYPSAQDAVLMPCVGTWGLVFKEWEVIKQTYPQSAQYLNKLTMTVDVDIYNGLSEKIKIDHLPEGSPIKVFLCNL